MSDEQAAEIEEAVKVLAKARGGGPRFGADYGELYRGFDVSRYRNIRAGAYGAVMAFLDELRERSK